MRLRIGYLPDSLPAAVPRALRRLAASVPAVQVELGSAPAWRLVDDVRRGRLDAAITSLPAPTNGLRSLPLGEQGAVVALPAMHPHAVEPEIAIERLAPERIVVLPYEANPAFRNAVVAMCHAEGSRTDVHRGCPAAGRGRPARRRRRAGARRSCPSP